VGELPGGLTDADFDNDGNTDLAVSNDRSKDVTILLGDGSGGFSTAAGSPLEIGASPGGVASADLNGDGRLDLVVPGYPNRLVVLLGDGTGGFAPAPGSPLTIVQRYGPDRADVADFNGDGRPDLAVSNDDPMRIAILLGDGTGRFRSSETIVAGLKAVADFNRDGKPDLAVASKSSGKATPYQAAVLLGTATGRFSAAPGSPMKGQYWSTEAVAGDFNGDRKLDLALCDGRGTVSLLLGDGRGRMRAAVDSPLELPASSHGGGLTAADINHDGSADLISHVRRDPEQGGAAGLAVLWRLASGPAVLSGGVFPSRRDAVFSTRAQIWKLGADGALAGVVTARGRPCGRIRVVVWAAPRRTSSNFDDTCLGDAVTRIALGGGQVSWLEQGGGNDLELTVNAARLPRGKPKEVQFTTNGNRAGGDPRGGWLGQLLGAGPVLAYNSWTLTCDVPDGYGCDGVDTKLVFSNQRLYRIVGTRRTTVKSGPASLTLAAVGGGRMAVESGGEIRVLAANGSQVAKVPPVPDNPPRAIALGSTRLAVLRTFSLDVYDPARGTMTKSIPLGPAAGLQLAGVSSKLALLRSARRLVLVRLGDGKLISLAPRPATHLASTLTTAGLFYAYNVRRGGRVTGRIVFEPTNRLMSRF
jgi:hypothetical protein